MRLIGGTKMTKYGIKMSDKMFRVIDEQRFCFCYASAEPKLKARRYGKIKKVWAVDTIGEYLALTDKI
jgi:hypothetical protein